MYTVEVNNLCSCAIKRGIADMQSFDTIEDAEAEAQRLLQQMQNEFCKKHRFELRKELNSFIIYIFSNR